MYARLAQLLFFLKQLLPFFMKKRKLSRIASKRSNSANSGRHGIRMEAMRWRFYPDWPRVLWGSKPLEAPAATRTDEQQLAVVSSDSLRS